MKTMSLSSIRPTAGPASESCRAALLLAATWLLSGCTAIPGAVPELENDEPDGTWTESRLRDTYGAPEWAASLADGGKVLFFDYKTAPSDRTLSALTAVTTFGLITDAGSLDFERLAVLDADGRLICADRDSLNYGSFTCPHERRLALLDELAGSQRQDYLDMLIRLDRRQYAPGHYELVAEPPISDVQIASARAAGAGDPYAADGAYYFAAECSVLLPWYAEHLAALGKSPAAARQAAPTYATAFNRMSAARGDSEIEAARDLDLLKERWQESLDRGNTTATAGGARACLDAAPGGASSDTLARIDRVYFAWLERSITLAQALAVRDNPDDPGGRSLPYRVQQPRGTPIAVGMPYNALTDAKGFGQLKRHSEAWREALQQKQEALREWLAPDAVATPVDVVERTIEVDVRSGHVPGRQTLRSLIARSSRALLLMTTRVQ